MIRTWWWSMVLVAACSGTPEGPPAAGGKSGPSGVAGEKSGAGPLDPALRASGQALVDALVPALKSCHALIDPIDPAAAEASKLAFDQAALDAACGAARDLYDANVEALSGKARQIDLMLTHAARLGDGVDYLSRGLVDIGSERKLSVTQLQEALGKATEAVTKWADVKVYAYRCSYTGEPGLKQWTLDLDNDGRDGPNLRNHLERFAFKQGLNPKQVRRRMLDVYGRTAAAYQPFREAALDKSDATPEVKAVRATYLKAYKAWIDTYLTVSKAYIAGEVVDAAVQTRLTTDTDAALAAWKAAWDVQKAAE